MMPTRLRVDASAAEPIRYAPQLLRRCRLFIDERRHATTCAYAELRPDAFSY